ncbi:MAG: type III polyketide synthase [Rhodospirillaceae bacterium]|nr:MAG: type III polyketide synthase [Rhodospirillaceae bacterium]
MNVDLSVLPIDRTIARVGLQPATPVLIHGVASAYPSFVFQQDEIMAQAQQVFATRPQLMERMNKSYDNAGVKTRNSCVPLSWYQSSHGWPERARLFEENAVALLTAAGRDVLAAAGVAASDVAATVTVSSTGIVTPSLDSLLQAPLGLAPTVQRLPVFGLGCAGGVIGLSRAAALARAMPGRWILFMCTELCGLNFRADDDSKSNVIASTLFGDGAAAIVLRAGEGDASDVADVAPGRVVLHAWGEHTWPDTRDIMGWRVEDDGLAVIFSRHIPSLVRDHMRPVTDAFLASLGMTHADLDGLIVHPGGEKVLAALEEVYALAPNDMADARAVLAEHGNMSAVTVLAVLQRALERGRTGRHLMLALGPGFSVGMCLVDLL